MKRAVNLRLEENIIYTLNQLSQELQTTKTDVIEKAISLFSKQNSIKKNNLLQFAGSMKQMEADKMLDNIQDSKNTKFFELTL